MFLQYLLFTFSPKDISTHLSSSADMSPSPFLSKLSNNSRNWPNCFSEKYSAILGVLLVVLLSEEGQERLIMIIKILDTNHIDYKVELLMYK